MSTDSPAGRLVFIGEDESIERLGAVEFARMVQRRFTAAPADPVDVIARALYIDAWEEQPDDVSDLSVARLTAKTMLAALGCPPSEHTRDAS